MTATEVDEGPVGEGAASVAPGRRRDDAIVAERWRPSVAIGAWAVVVAPLVVAAVAMRSPTWFPVADLAQYELRVRDVGTGDTPLVGLAGRIGPWFDPGSHPGPLSFWFLAPVYRLLGGSSWALVVSSVFLHAVAAGLVLWAAWRRAGVTLVVAVAAGLAVLSRFYGPEVFVEPWNPYLPVLWWLVLLTATWSVLDRDLALLPVAVVAGTFCAQTHLPYVGLVGGLGGFLVAMVGLWVVAARRGGPPAPPNLGRWLGASVALAVVLWTPPVLDQIWGAGNLSRIRDSVSNPTEGVTGLGGGLAELVRNLDPIAFVTGRDLTGVSEGSGIAWGGLVLVLAWVAAAGVVAVRRVDHPTLARLHLVVAAALVLAVVSSTRIYGLVWSYLFLWSWGLAMVMVVATGWSAVAVLGPRLAHPPDLVVRRAGVGALAVIGIVAAGAFAVGNVDTRPERQDLSDDLGALSAQTVEAIGDDPVGGGRDGRYLVRWVDRVTIGSQGFGLVNQLERVGFDVGVDAPFGVGATRHRILDVGDATGVLQLVVGPDIPAWDDRPEAARIAYVDARTDAERARYDETRASIDVRLREAGLDDLAREWEQNLFTASLDPRVPEPIHLDMQDLLAIRAPVAVYLLDPGDV